MVNVAVFLLLLLPLLSPLSVTGDATSSSSSPSPSPSPFAAGCPTQCGDVQVPYPFGIRPGCARDKDFNLTCDGTSKPSISVFGMGVLEILVGKGLIRVTTFQDLISGGELLTMGRYSVVNESALLKWVVDKVACKDAVKDMSSYACVSDNSGCHDDIIATFGYHCECSPGYEGNPYLLSGCTDVDECLNPESYKCYGECNNIPGSYRCTCPQGTIGDPTKRQCLSSSGFSGTSPSFIVLGISTGLGGLILVLGIFYCHQKWKKINVKKLKAKHFHQNRGLLLQQLISSNEDVAERTKIFSLIELEKATNNFDESRILGRGGHGTVYKGILSDQRVVAIKKSKITVQSEIDQFINEVALLSQISHRNVVKLLGCCLEAQVPLLVYEFISNGTISDHLHVSDRKSTLSWRNRLRIAAEAAGALAYLHSAASVSIFHRDVKSSNILLDDNYTAKVSDFGASRSIPLDQTRVTTMIQGTFGYLDPEYFHTSQLTEKSDVYSFGVILVELLTGKKPVTLTTFQEERNLATHFIWLLKENRLFELVEARVTEEGTREEIEAVAELAELCLRLRGEERPTMNEVAAQLDGFRRLKKKQQAHPWNADVDALSKSLVLQVSEDSSTIDNSRQYSLQKELLLSLEYRR